MASLEEKIATVSNDVFINKTKISLYKLAIEVSKEYPGANPLRNNKRNKLAFEILQDIEKHCCKFSFSTVAFSDVNLNSTDEEIYEALEDVFDSLAGVSYKEIVENDPIYETLKEEVNNDPKSLGYKNIDGSWKGEYEIARILNEPKYLAVQPIPISNLLK